MQLVTIVMPALLRTTKDDAVNKSEYTVYLLYTCNMVRLSRNNNNKCWVVTMKPRQKKNRPTLCIILYYYYLSVRVGKQT